MEAFVAWNEASAPQPGVLVAHTAIGPQVGRLPRRQFEALSPPQASPPESGRRRSLCYRRPPT